MFKYCYRQFSSGLHRRQRVTPLMLFGLGVPLALVPANDPMVLVNGQPNLFKTNAYRIGVDQLPAPFASANTTTYCTNLLNIAPARLQLDKAMTMAQAAMPATAPGQ